jgi:hypothetical protein
MRHGGTGAEWFGAVPPCARPPADCEVAQMMQMILDLLLSFLMSLFQGFLPF